MSKKWPYLISPTTSLKNAELPKGFYPKFKLSTVIFYMEMAFFILISSCLMLFSKLSVLTVHKIAN